MFKIIIHKNSHHKLGMPSKYNKFKTEKPLAILVIPVIFLTKGPNIKLPKFSIIITIINTAITNKENFFIYLFNMREIFVIKIFVIVL